MPSKRQREQWKNARRASLQTFKKRKQESCSILHLAQPQIDDNKLDTSDTSDTEGASRTWFWNESADEEEGHSDMEEPSLEGGQPSYEK